MLQRTFVRRNLLNGDKTPENISQDSTILPNERFDRIYERLRATLRRNTLSHPISHRSISESPCEIGYVKSGYDVTVYLINGGTACLIDNYQALSGDGKDIIQKQIVLFHENSSGLESLCKFLIG